MHKHVKYWILPDINNRIKDGAITAYFTSNVTRITEDDVTIATPLGNRTTPNQFVFALTGYHPDFSFLEKLGIRFDEANDRCPLCNPATLESNVPESTSPESSSAAAAPTRSSSRTAASTASSSPKTCNSSSPTALTIRFAT